MWQKPKNKITELEDDEAHIWFVNKKRHQDRYNFYWELLTNEEQKKANHFRFNKDKTCFVIARAILRILLGNYLDQAPESIVFDAIKNGKPFVANEKNVQFNISHSEDCILLAFVKKNAVGIDVEYTKRPVEVETIARSFFSEEEASSLLALDKSYHKQAFYNCWTRKEAFIKALGNGLAFPLNQFVVSLDSEKRAELLATKWDVKEKEKWVLKSIQLKENYIGAIAIKGKVEKTKFWKYK